MAEEKTKKTEEAQEEVPEEESINIFALRTTANREDQVFDFLESNVNKLKKQRAKEMADIAKKFVKDGRDKDSEEVQQALKDKSIEDIVYRKFFLGEEITMEEIANSVSVGIYSVIRPHAMRGYIFLEAGKRSQAEQAAFGIPYARGILPRQVDYKEIEHMLEQVKKEVNIQKNDICEIISGPFKREKAKITRIDKTKEEVVVELLESAVPIPITVKMDSIKVIRRD